MAKIDDTIAYPIKAAPIPTTQVLLGYDPATSTAMDGVRAGDLPVSTAMQTALTAETNRATAAEVVIQEDLYIEVQDRTFATDAITADLAAEIARATAADTEQIKSANFTAVAGESYVTTASATVTDPASPTNGQSYRVRVSAGTATVGGVAYAVAGSVITRSYNAGAWANNVLPTPADYTALFDKAPDRGVTAENLDQAPGVTNARIWEIKHFWNKLYAASQGTGLATLVVYGDSVANNESYNHILELWARYGFGGAAISPNGSGYDRGHGVTLAGGAALINGTSGAGAGDSAVFQYSATGSWYSIPVGGTLDWGVLDDGFEHSGVVVHYITEPGAGTFKIQYRGCGSNTWIDESGYTSVNAAATLGAVAIRISRTKAKWLHRIVGLTGTVKISTTTGVFNTSGMRFVLLNKGGIALTDTNYWAPAISNVVLADMDPTLITMEMKEAPTYPGLPAFEAILTAAGVSDTTDVNYIGSMQFTGDDTPPQNQRLQNQVLYKHARAYGRCYWSAYDSGESYAKIAQAFSVVDGTHLNESARSFFSAQWARDLRIFGMPGVVVKKSTISEILSSTGDGYISPEYLAMAQALQTQCDLKDSNLSSPAPYLFNSFCAYYFTSATPSEEIFSYTGSDLVSAGYENPPLINWNMPVGFPITFAGSGVISTRLFRFVLGAADKNIQSISSIGIEVRGARLWLLVHNGTTLTQKDTGYDVPDNRTMRFYLRSNGAGLVTLYNLTTTQLGDTPELMAQTLGGPTGAATFVGSYGFLVYATNGATASVVGMTVARRFNLRMR